MRTIAIDWSGAKSGERSKIPLAKVRAGSLVRLENGRSRTGVIKHVEEASRDPHLVVGLDFAFSLPAWFLAQRSLSRIEDLWSQVDQHGEAWLRDCKTPFWGRPGKRKPDLDEHCRVTERTATVGGISAKSVFQISAVACHRAIPARTRCSRHAFGRHGYAPIYRAYCTHLSSFWRPRVVRQSDEAR